VDHEIRLTNERLTRVALAVLLWYALPLCRMMTTARNMPRIVHHPRMKRRSSAFVLRLIALLRELISKRDA
jgi:hypothetical protein